MPDGADIPPSRPSVVLVDGFPDGWMLGDDTWRFHRWFHARVGRPAQFGEYSSIRNQVRDRKAERLGKHWTRCVTKDGVPIVVRGNWNVLLEVERGDFVPTDKPKQRVIPPAETKVAAAPPQPAREPPAPPAPAIVITPRKPLRASTLTLGNPAAAKAAADRLRKRGVGVNGP